jgi:hypothetical protein
MASSGWKSGFNIVRVEFGGNVTAGGLKVSFDEIRLGTSWTDVSSDQYLARESFEYPVGTSLDTLMGTSGNGWSGSWYKAPLAKQANAMVVADTGLPYDALNYTVANAGNHLEGRADSNEQRYARNLDKVWPNVAGQVYWVSLLIDVKNAVDNATWFGVKLYAGATGEVMMFGKGHGLAQYTLGSGWHGSAGPEVSTVSWDVGPVWLVAKIIMKGPNSITDPPDSAYMWISPDPLGGDPSTTTTPDAMASSGWKSGFNIVRVEFGGNVTAGGLKVSFDEIRLGTSWTDVSTQIVFTGVSQERYELPFQFALSQNYPNPFNPATIISYTLLKSGRVRLAVYDLLGREVAVLVDGDESAGSHQLTFSRPGLSSGIYFYRLETSRQAITKKMLLLK